MFAFPRSANKAPTQSTLRWKRQGTTLKAQYGSATHGSSLPLPVHTHTQRIRRTQGTMTSTTVRTDFVKDENGKHQVVKTTMTVVRADEKDETISPEYHESVETVAYEPAPQPSIDQARPCTKPGKPHEDQESNWNSAGLTGQSSPWPSQMR